MCQDAQMWPPSTYDLRVVKCRRSFYLVRKLLLAVLEAGGSAIGDLAEGVGEAERWRGIDQWAVGKSCSSEWIGEDGGGAWVAFAKRFLIAS